MPPVILKNCKCYLGGYDLSGDLNEMALNYSAELKEVTTYGNTSRRRIAGLKDTMANLNGYWQAGDNPEEVDKIILDGFSTARDALTICPQTGAAGEVGFCFRPLLATYSPAGQVGELFAFSVEAQGRDAAGLIRGTVMDNGARTVTGAGTARQLGAIAEGKKLYAVMHVLAVSGTSPTLDVVIQSDDAEGMASPADRITFDQVSAIGSQWKELAGPITDDWWRANFTVGGTNPSFTVVIVLGIQ